MDESGSSSTVHPAFSSHSQELGPETIEKKAVSFVSKEFSGAKGYNGHWFRHPARDDAKKDDDPTLYTYTNQFGEDFQKHHDVATYLSGSEYRPRRLLVQATPRVWKTQQNTRWRRTQMKGNVPSALKISQWALDPLDPIYVKNEESGELEIKRRAFLGTMWAGFQVTLRTLLICIPLQLYLALPLSKSPCKNAWITETDWY
jgi:hypothetical protein